MTRSAASPIRISPATIIAFAESAPPDGLTLTRPAPGSIPSASQQDQLLVRKRCVQLGDVDLRRLPSAQTGSLGRQAGRRRFGQVPGSECVGLDAVVETCDPSRARAELRGPVAGRKHDCGRTVGDRRHGVPAKRGHDEVLLEHRRR